MGARWAWVAICEAGHVYSNFSGGADDCYECGKPPAREIQCPHLWDDRPCDCKERILVDPSLCYDCRQEIVITCGCDRRATDA